MVSIANLTTKDVTGGLVMRVRIARSFSIRIKLACWLIGLAGRVIDVPCEIELCADGLKD